MSLKHNANQSDLLKAFELAAIEKGLIKYEIKKEAAKKELDLTPSNNLTVNLLKLCSGLRKSGMEKYAEELENKFVSYKKAGGDVYDVSKETGEDLINSAHPDGSHKIEGVEGDSVVETILDQHLKNMKIVEKKPTGKLSNANEIIGAVKSVLIKKAQAAAVKPPPPKDMNSITEEDILSWRKFISVNELNKIIGYLNKAKHIFDVELDNPAVKSIFNKNYGEIINELSKINSGNISVESINEIINDIDDIKAGKNTLWVVDVIYSRSDSEKKDTAYVYVEQALQAAYSARTIIQGRNDNFVKQNIISEEEKSQKKEQIPTEISSFNESLKKAKNRINADKAAIRTDIDLDDNEKQAPLIWLDKRLNAINEIEKEFNSLSDEQKLGTVKSLLLNLNKITSKLDKFEQEWV